MLSTSARTQHRKTSEAKGIYGVPGNIYVLRNSGLKEGLLQIGLSRRSGWAKAFELNRDKSNTIPGHFECVFELLAQDGGSAKDAILLALQEVKRGRTEQDYFEIDVVKAQEIIKHCVHEADLLFQNRYRYETRLLALEELEERKHEKSENEEVVGRDGIFQKVFSWITAEAH